MKTKKDYYSIRKADVRQQAMDWQSDFANHNYSYGEIAWFQGYFETLGRRYGLLREFRAEGIC